MTCIVAIKTPKKIYIGADSAGVSASDLTIERRADPKIHKGDKFIFGGAGSFRAIQLMSTLVLPKQKTGQTDFQYMCVDFVKAVQKLFEKNGFDGINKRSERSVEAEFIIGYNNELYVMSTDYQIAMLHKNYNAIGCGAGFALGSLHATENIPGMKPKDRITKALQAADEFSAGVCEPFLIEEY